MILDVKKQVLSCFLIFVIRNSRGIRVGCSQSEIRCWPNRFAGDRSDYWFRILRNARRACSLFAKFAGSAVEMRDGVDGVVGLGMTAVFRR